MGRKRLAFGFIDWPEHSLSLRKSPNIDQGFCMFLVRKIIRFSD